MPTTFSDNNVLTAAALNSALTTSTNDAVAAIPTMSAGMRTIVNTAPVVAWNSLAASGMLTTTPSVSFGPVGNAFSTNGVLVQQCATTSGNQREFAAAFGLESHVGQGGSSGGIHADKVALYAGIEGFSGSADIWAINSVTRLVSGFPSSGFSLGYELDFNNEAADRGTQVGFNAFAAPTAIGILVTGGGTLNSTSAVSVQGGAASGSSFTGTWQHGISVVNSTQSSFFDWSHATAGFVSYGTHVYGIDLKNLGLFSGGHSVRLANGGDICARNQADSTDLSLLFLDASNNLQIGWGGTGISVNAANLVPVADNTCNLGGGSLRFQAVFAVNGTVQTSDPTLKTEITPIPSALAIIGAVEPVSFKWVEGGFDTVEVIERQMVHATEEQEHENTTIELIDGKHTQVARTVTHTAHLYDEIPLHDEAGNPVMVEIPARFRDANNLEAPTHVQKTHRVPRMVEADVVVQKTVSKPGKRTHLGFLAPDVRDAFAKHWSGMDTPGAYVQTEDGTHHLRPDQLIPVLWKGNQELQQRIDKMGTKIDKLEAQLERLITRSA